MPGVVTHAAGLVDQPRDALGRPQARAEPERLGPPLESGDDTPVIPLAELRLAAGATRVLQGRAAASRELLGPAIDRLAVRSNLPCHLRFAQPSLEQVMRPKPALL